jgi:hypothetical protein
VRETPAYISSGAGHRTPPLLVLVDAAWIIISTSEPPGSERDPRPSVRGGDGED